jgi:antitoxin component of RelBE/YafQ-DinJ toxin-antitoxin module
MAKEYEYILNMRIPKELADKLKEKAKSMNISMSSLVRIVLTECIKEK